MNSSNLLQSVLISELNARNPEAYKHLFDRYYNELCVFAKSFLDNADQAEDIVQDIMFSLWKKTPNIHIKTSIKSYLYKSVYNGFVNSHRIRRKNLTLIDELKGEVMLSFAAQDEDLVDIRVQFIRKEIEELPKKCKEVFQMSRIHGLKNREIADELKISVKTVEAHISKALKQIKNRAFQENSLI